MKTVLKGVDAENEIEKVEMTIEFQGNGKWYIKVKNTELVVADLEQAMEFLKAQYKES